MRRHECISCGTFIVESALKGPYMCSDCEKLHEGVQEAERLLYMENL